MVSNRGQAIDRVMVFIDGSNLYHSLRTHYNRINLDYQKLGDRLAEGRRLVRTYYYGARLDLTRQPEQYQAQQRFFDYLGRIPRVELRLGRLVYPSSPNATPAEKGVDVKIATDMLLYASRDNYDVAILVSGDTDFVDMVQAVKDMGKNVETVLFGRNSSQALREVTDKVIEASSPFLEDCWR